MLNGRLSRLCAVLLVVAGGSGAAVASDVDLPSTPAARHAAAWLEGFNSGEAEAMRAMYEEHLAAEALARRSMEDRLGRYEQSHGRFGTLTPVRVVEVTDDFVRLVVKPGAEGLPYLQLDFDCEKNAPFGIERVALSPVSSPEAAGRRPPALAVADLPARFDAYLTEKAQSDEFSGVVLVAKQGVSVFRKAYGTAERRFDVPNRVDTRFNIGSIGKLITQMAVAQLAETGKLRLEDKLARWLPDWPRESAEKITIEHLVMHRSGVPDFLNEPYLRERFFQLDRSRLRHNSDFLPIFRDEPLLFEPGTSERYSNSGFVLLGEIVGRASGEDYYDYVRKHILEPAGMKNSGYFEGDDVTPNVATGYYPDGNTDGALRANTILLWPRGFAAGGPYATADDLLRFEEALRGGKLASPAWSRWVIGGPNPGDAAGEEPMPDGYVLAGGAEGITARLSRVGEWTLVVLSNLDRRIMSEVEDHLQELLAAVDG